MRRKWAVLIIFFFGMIVGGGGVYAWCLFKVENIASVLVLTSLKQNRIILEKISDRDFTCAEYYLNKFIEADMISLGAVLNSRINGESDAKDLRCSKHTAIPPES